MRNDQLNQINARIRESSQWVKNFKANPEQYGSATTSSSSSSNTSGTSTSASDLSQLQQLLSNNANSGMMSVMQFMLLMMMFQVMSGTQGASTSGTSPFQMLSNALANNNLATSGLNNTSTLDNSTVAQDAEPEVPEGLEILQEYFKAAPDAENTPECLLQDWETAGLDKSELSDAVKYMVQNGDDSLDESFSAWLPALIQNGAVQSTDMLNGSYLSDLSNDRLALISGSVAESGLADADGKTRTALCANLLSKATQTPTDEATELEQLMAKDILYGLWQQNPEDDTLLNVLRLAGSTQDDAGKWQWPFETPETEATV